MKIILFKYLWLPFIALMTIGYLPKKQQHAPTGAGYHDGMVHR
jgi:hypothetical protein